MANNNICGRVTILLKIPDGGIDRITGLPGDPEQIKGDYEILSEIIESGISGTNWEYSGVTKSGASIDSISLVYNGGG